MPARERPEEDRESPNFDLQSTNSKKGHASPRGFFVPERGQSCPSGIESDAN